MVLVSAGTATNGAARVDRPRLAVPAETRKSSTGPMVGGETPPGAVAFKVLALKVLDHTSVSGGSCGE